MQDIFMSLYTERYEYQFVLLVVCVAIDGVWIGYRIY
jgi:hypothetical protein